MTLKYLLFPFLCSLLACLLLARLAPYLSLMDRPDARKQHGRAVPVVGGLAILISYFLALKLRGLSGNLSEAILPVGFLLLVGMVDDARPMPARLKLIGQFVAAWLLLKTTGYAQTGSFMLWLICLIGIVATVNAINMSDGADGLAGGYVIVALGFLCALALGTGHQVVVLLVVGLMAAVAGFLVCNARHPWLARAHVFMGDAGAMTLGLLLCWFFIVLTRTPGSDIPAALLLYACGLPLMDMVTVATRRMLNGRNPMRADRTHLHHLLMLEGMRVELSVVLLWALQVSLAGLGFLLWRMGAGTLVLVLVWLFMLVAKMLWMRVWESHEADSGAEPRA